MKRIKLIVSFCVLIFCMIGCGKGEDSEDNMGVAKADEELAVSPYEAGESDESITDLTDVNLTLQKIDKDKKKLEITMENVGERTYRYGKYFEIEKMVGNKWYQLVQINKDSDDLGGKLESKTDVNLNYDIGKYYNLLTNGKYRIIIQLYYMENERDWDYKTYNIALDFKFE